jgi:hypothetical protein
MDLLRRCDGDDAGTSGPTNRSRKGISELQSTELVDSAEISECLGAVAKLLRHLRDAFNWPDGIIIMLVFMMLKAGHRRVM